jgi:hypothetical protein
MMERIWRTGLRITCDADLNGLPSIEDGEEEHDEEHNV